jgi:transporter family protein
MMVSGGFNALQSVPTPSWFWLTLEAICATVLGDLAYFAALKCGTAGTVSVILSAAPLITLLIALIFLQEKLNLLQICGVCLVVMGLWLLNSSCH